MPSLDQKRGLLALSKVSNLRGETAKDFATDCKKTISRIQMCGLPQTVAFLEAKGEYKEILSAITKHLETTVFAGEGQMPLMERLLKADAFKLSRAVDETQALLQWMARLADGNAKR